MDFQSAHAESTQEWCHEVEWALGVARGGGCWDEWHRAGPLKLVQMVGQQQQQKHKRVNWRSKYVTQVQQQRPESPKVTLTSSGCTSGGVYAPCIYMHARWDLPQVTQVFAVVLVLHISTAN